MIATRVMLQTFAMAPHSPPDTNIMEDLSTDLERAVHTRWCANLARRTRGLLREGMQILRTRIQQRYERYFEASTAEGSQIFGTGPFAYLFLVLFQTVTYGNEKVIMLQIFKNMCL